MKLSVGRSTLKLKQPLETAKGVIAERFGFRVTFETAGVTGRGEAFPLQAWGTESVDEADRALSQFEVEKVPTSIDEIAEVTSRLESTPTARFAAESALLEYLARSKKISVAARFAATFIPEVNVSALIAGDSAQALTEAGAQAVKRGFRTVKTKVARRPLSVDAQRLLALRRAIGPDVALRIDANEGWSEARALSALRGFESLNIEVCEQPIRASDVEGLRRLSWHVPTPIAADETLAIPDARTHILSGTSSPVVDVLVLKPAVLGGIIPALKLAERAAQIGLRCYVTTMLDGPIACAAAATLAAVIPGGDMAHGLATEEHFDPSTESVPAAVNGKLRVPNHGWSWR